MILNYTYETCIDMDVNNEWVTKEVRESTDIDSKKGWYYIVCRIADTVFEKGIEKAIFYAQDGKKIAEATVLSFDDTPILIEMYLKNTSKRVMFKYDNVFNERFEVDTRIYFKPIRNSSGIAVGYAMRDTELDFNIKKTLVYNLKVLNYKSKELSYSDYKDLYQIITDENNAEALYNMCFETDLTDGLYDILESRLNTALNNSSNTVREISTYDERYPNNPYYFGYEINGHNFWVGYTGSAGKYWTSLCLYR